MKRHISIALFLVLSLSWFASIQATHASVTITAVEIDGNVVFSYSGSINTAFLEPRYGPDYSVIRGRLAPDSSLIYFADTDFSAPNALKFYTDPVTTSPASMGSGNLTFPSSFTGSYFIITPLFVGVPSNYVSGSQISGTMTFEGATFESLGLNTDPGSYLFTLTNLESVTVAFEAPSTELSPETILKRKIAQLKYRLRLAEKRKKRAIIKRLKIAIPRLQAKLSALRAQG